MLRWNVIRLNADFGMAGLHAGEFERSVGAGHGVTCADSDRNAGKRLARRSIGDGAEQHGKGEKRKTSDHPGYIVRLRHTALPDR